MDAAIATMTAQDFARVAHVSRETLARMEIFADHLVRWQSAINLVGRDTLTNIWQRHFLDAAQLAEYMPENTAEIIDMGSGAGFPGLVLAILLDRPVHLIEASGKKAAFLSEAARLTGAPAIVHHQRIEDMEPVAADVITARALAPLDMLLDYAAPFLDANAARHPVCLFPKGAQAAAEIDAAARRWSMVIDRFPSRSDPAGTVLRIRDIVRG